MVRQADIDDVNRRRQKVVAAGYDVEQSAQIVRRAW